jgi:DNA-directed RNA polymerase specialized sigma24 family protein
MEPAATDDVALRQAGERQVAELYARVGVRAWRLAVWIVHDERAASDVVLAAFRAAQQDARLDDGGDAGLLIDVRRRALAVAGARRRRVETDCATMRATVRSLSEPQRGVIELALFGDLTISSIAAATDTPRGEVLRLMVDGLCALRMELAVRGPATP